MKTKRAARVVLLDGDDKVAILHVGVHDYYKIPGGGMEEGETLREAAQRETREEAGCDCDILAELGRIETDIAGWELHDISDGFVARVVGEKRAPEYDSWERERGFSVEWHESLVEAIRVIEGNVVTDADAVSLQARDLAFLKLAMGKLNLS